MVRTELPSEPLFGSLKRPDNLPDEIAQQLRQKIVSKAFEPGRRLPTELELSENFGVSRNVVREAIARLKLSGYIETRRGVGSFVAQDIGQRNFEIVPQDLLQSDALEQVYELRVEIEGGAAALAAMHRTEEQLSVLQSALAQVDASGHDWRQGAETALDFHMAVGHATNNPYFVRLLTHFSHVIRDAMRTLRYSHAGTDRVVHIEHEHHLIYNAIAARDSDGARQAMRLHLTNGMQRRKALLKGTKT